MPNLMRTSLLHTLPSLLRVNQHELAKVPAGKLRSYLVAVLARAGDYPDSRRMQSTVQRRQYRAPPAQYVPCFSRASERHYSVTRCELCSVFPALFRLVHAACRTSALNQNYVALVYSSRSCLAHDCGIARTHDTRLICAALSGLSQQ